MLEMDDELALIELGERAFNFWWWESAVGPYLFRYSRYVPRWT